MKKEFDPSDIRLINVGVYKSNISVGFDVNQIRENFHAYHFCFAQQSGLNLNDGAVRIRLNVSIKARDKNKNILEAKCEFDIDFHFSIHDFQSYLHFTEDESPRISKHLGNSMLGIAYSTARGIIFSRTDATVLSGILLPVIDPENLLNDSYEIVSNT